MARLMILLLLLTRVKSNVIKELNLQWGYKNQCTKLNLFPDITITGCYKECLYRVKCKSFIYLVHYKRCMLCANEENLGNIGSRSAGHVYSQKSKWNEALRSSGCQCAATEACHTQDASQPCKVKECTEQPSGTTEGMVILGNMMGVGNHVMYTCPDIGLLENGRATCRDDGSWTAAPSIACFGCYEDKPSPRALSYGPYEEHTTMSTQRCLEICRDIYTDTEKIYFATQWGTTCFCGTTFTESMYPQTPETECNFMCPANQTQICGGNWRMNSEKHKRNFFVTKVKMHISEKMYRL